MSYVVRPWASALRCHGRWRPRCRRVGAVRSRPTGCASWNLACPGPRGSGLCVRPLFFGPDVGRVEDDAGDVDQAGVVEPVQHCFVEAAPDTGSRPDEEPAVGRGFRDVEARRLGPPGAAAHQDVDDGRKQRLIRCVLRPADLWSHDTGPVRGSPPGRSPSRTSPRPPCATRTSA